MIKKEELLAFMNNSLDKEEKGIPLYTMHLSNAMFLSRAPAADQQKVKDVLATLKKDSERHKKTYEALISKVNRESKDVY